MITDGSKYKFGYTTKDVEKRLAELQTGNPEKLKVCNSVKGSKENIITTEKIIKKLTSPFATKGGSEWRNFQEKK